VCAQTDIADLIAQTWESAIHYAEVALDQRQAIAHSALLMHLKMKPVNVFVTLAGVEPIAKPFTLVMAIVTDVTAKVRTIALHVLDIHTMMHEAIVYVINIGLGTPVVLTPTTTCLSYQTLPMVIRMTMVSASALVTMNTQCHILQLIPIACTHTTTTGIWEITITMAAISVIAILRAVVAQDHMPLTVTVAAQMHIWRWATAPV